MKKLFKVSAILLVIAMLAAFASCGGNNDSKGDVVKVVDIALTDENYAFGVAKNDAALQESVNSFIKEIKENGELDKIVEKYFGKGTPEAVVSAKEDSSKDQLVVVTNAAFPPFEYVEGDSFYGIDMEMAKLLADKLGKELVIKNVDFDAVCTTVDSGYADVAAAGLTVNEDRKEFVAFSEPYYKASQMVIAKADDTTFDGCKTVEDVEKILNGLDSSKKIGYQTGTTGEYYVTGDESWGFAGFDALGVGYSTGALAVQDLINGNLDYVVIDEAPAKMIVSSYNAKNA